MGLSWAITDPARISLIPNIIPRERLVNAFALNAMAFSISRLAAPALGGLLLSVAGPGTPMVLVATLPLVAIVMVLRIQLKAEIKPRLRLASAFSELLEGARYVKSEPVILGLFLLAIIPSVLVMPFVYGLMPVYAAEVFAVGPAGLGLLLSAIGVGSTTGTLALASFARFRYHGRLVIISIVLMALAMLAFSQSPGFGSAIPTVMVLSGGMMMFFTITNASIQSIVRDDYRGRVSGLYMVTWGLFPVGSLVAGSIAESFGAPMATFMASGLVVAALWVISLRFRRIWSFGSESATSPEQTHLEA